MNRQITRFCRFFILERRSASCFCSDDAMINLSFGVPVGDQHNQHRRLQEGASWHLDEAPFLLGFTGDETDKFSRVLLPPTKFTLQMGYYVNRNKIGTMIDCLHVVITISMLNM